MINDELGRDGYRPPRRIDADDHGPTIAASRGCPAPASSPRPTTSAGTARTTTGRSCTRRCTSAQGYRRGPRPGWLVEGISDYVRFFKWEPEKLGRIDPATARYDRGYRVTAAFLAYLVERYDREIVRRLNRALRAGEYDDDLFRQITGKTVHELDEEWRATLRR